MFRLFLISSLHKSTVSHPINRHSTGMKIETGLKTSQLEYKAVKSRSFYCWRLFVSKATIPTWTVSSLGALFLEKAAAEHKLSCSAVYCQYSPQKSAQRLKTGSLLVSETADLMDSCVLQ